MELLDPETALNLSLLTILGANLVWLAARWFLRSRGVAGSSLGGDLKALAELSRRAESRSERMLARALLVALGAGSASFLVLGIPLLFWSIYSQGAASL